MKRFERRGKEEYEKASYARIIKNGFLYAELMKWAEDDFRSVNGQIEYLLTECVKYRTKHGKDDKGGDGNE